MLSETKPKEKAMDKPFLFGSEPPKEIWVTEFTDDSAQQFREQVMARFEEDPSKPITIYIDSYGGSVDALAKMIETMNECPNQFVTVCMGKAMSAGAILLSHGDVRCCGRFSRIMIHEVLGGAGGNVHDLHADAAEVMRLNKMFIGIMAENCGIEGGYEGLRAIIKEKDERDLYLDAEKALEFGIVDYIGIPKVIPAIAHEIILLPPKQRQPVETRSLEELFGNMGMEVEYDDAAEEKSPGKTKPKRSSVKKKRKSRRKS